MSEMSCNDFVKSMKAAGFDFTYRATSGSTAITGEVKKNGDTSVKKHQTVEASRLAIKQLFKGEK